MVVVEGPTGPLTVETTPSRLTIRFARPDESEEVSSVLLEADAWLRARDVPLWSLDELSPAALRGDVASGRYVVAVSSGDSIGVARLAQDDPICWPEAKPGAAWYIHRLAVRRAHAGGIVSRAILDWVATRAASDACQYLRLDCDATRSQLRELYERFGFTFHSTHAVGPHTVARYQKRLAAP